SPHSSPSASRRHRHPPPTRRSSDLEQPADLRGQPQVLDTFPRPSPSRASGYRTILLLAPPASPVWFTPASNWQKLLAEHSSRGRSEEHTLNSSHVKSSYAVLCLKAK